MCGLPTVGTYVLWVSVGTEATVEPYVRAFLRGKILICTGETNRAADMHLCPLSLSLELDRQGSLLIGKVGN